MTTPARNAYDAVASEYAAEFADELDHKPLDREMLTRFAARVGPRKPVCDLGCGPGQTTAYLAKQGATVFGLDLSHPMLVEARGLCPRLSFVQGDMLSLPFPDESIAGVAAFYAIVHFSRDELLSAFREMARVLASGGLALIAFHIGDETIHVDEFLGQRVPMDFVFFPTDEIAGVLRNAGMTVEEVVERDPYPEVEYQSRRAYVLARKHG